MDKTLNISRGYITVRRWALGKRVDFSTSVVSPNISVHRSQNAKTFLTDRGCQDFQRISPLYVHLIRLGDFLMNCIWDQF